VAAALVYKSFWTFVSFLPDFPTNHQLAMSLTFSVDLFSIFFLSFGGRSLLLPHHSDPAASGKLQALGQPNGKRCPK